MCVYRDFLQVMDDIVDLSESSQCPSTEAPIGVEVGFGSEFLDNLTPASSAPTAERRVDIVIGSITNIVSPQGSGA